MKYTHHLKCGEVKNSKGGRPRKAEIKINEIVQEHTPPSPAPIQKVKEVKQLSEPKPQPPKNICKRSRKNI